MLKMVCEVRTEVYNMKYEVCTGKCDARSCSVMCLVSQEIMRNRCFLTKKILSGSSLCNAASF